MKTIQIQNGKAFYEGYEIENPEDLVLPSEAINPSPHPGLSKFIDGTYPLPEGWGVVKEYWILDDIGNWVITLEVDYKYCSVKRRKQTARLIRKENKHKCQDRCDWPNCTLEGCIVKYEEQNSAHGYTEGSEFYKPSIQGKRELEDAENISRLKNMLETQPSAPTKEELRKEFDKMLKAEVVRINNVINPSPTLNDSVFDWLYSKLLTYQQEIDNHLNALMTANNEITLLKETVGKLQAFKDYVHKRSYPALKRRWTRSVRPPKTSDGRNNFWISADMRTPLPPRARAAFAPTKVGRAIP